MRKTILAVIVLFAFSVSGTSQTFEQGDNVINVGIGPGSALNAGNGKPNLDFNASYERGIWKAGPGLVSLGGYAGRVSFKDNGSGPGYSYEQKRNYTVIGVRGA